MKPHTRHPLIPLPIWSSLLALLLGCERTHDQVISGTATIPGAPPGTSFIVDAQTLDGRRVGSGSVAPDGSFSLVAEVPSGVAVLLIGAAATTDPELRAYAVANLTIATVTAALGEGDTTPTPPFVTTLDARSTATAILMTASGRIADSPADFAARHPGPIDRLSGALTLAPGNLCSVGATGPVDAPHDSLSSAVREVNATEVSRSSPLPLLSTIRTLATTPGQSIEWRLGAAQREISASIFSTNLPRMRLLLDTPLGLTPLALLRIGIWALTGESLLELNDKPLELQELDGLAAMTAAAHWGNCREKAYMAAYAASFVPEVKQLAILGVRVAGVGEHAVAIACTEGPEVYDLSKYESFSAKLPGNGQSCWVVDPWAPAAWDAPPGTGHVARLDAAYIQRASWEIVIVNKPVRLTPPVIPHNLLEVGTPGSSMQVCADSDGVSCSAPPPPPPDADTSVAPDTSPGDTIAVDTGPTCPEYPPDGQPCGAQLEGCIEGFYCSRETIACEQTVCPEGAGRTYTLECCCNCWDDQSRTNVYDPCRSGFLLRCE